jgi:hypothetical protein
VTHARLVGQVSVGSLVQNVRLERLASPQSIVRYAANLAWNQICRKQPLVANRAQTVSTPVVLERFVLPAGPIA